MQTDLVKELEKMDVTLLESVAEDMRVSDWGNITALSLVNTIIMTTETRDIFGYFKKLLSVLHQRNQIDAHKLLKCEIHREQLRMVMKCVVKQFRPNVVIPKMYKNRLFEPKEKQVLDAITDSEAKAQFLLEKHVLKLDRSKFEEFVGILRVTGHEDIAGRIEV